MEILVFATALKTQMIISQSMMEYDTIIEIETLEKDNAIYLCYSEVNLGSLPHIRWSSSSFQPWTFVTKSSILNPAKVVDPPMQKARKVEINTHVWSSIVLVGNNSIIADSASNIDNLTSMTS